MCVIYFDKQTYRKDMRSPNSSARAHAICRRLVGVPSSWDGRDIHYPGAYHGRGRNCNSLSHWYGAHYYAACAATSLRESKIDALRFWRRAFAREISGGEGKNPERLVGGWKALWRLAARRVWQLREDAAALDTSVRW